MGFKLVLLLSIGVGLITGLGILRYRSSQLAWYLESVNDSIQKFSDEEVILRQELSALVAPIRIYSYCKEVLGMQKVLKAEVISVHAGGNNLASRKSSPEEEKGWLSKFSWLIGK